MKKKSIEELPDISKATFKRHTEKFWELWPLSCQTGEIHNVVFVDGIYVSKRLVVLIACTKSRVLAWHLATSESSQSWAALMLKLAPPIMVVTDGGKGFKKALKAIWPETKVQRCLAHIKRQIIRKTTQNPKLECGPELLKLAQELPRVKGGDMAAKWMADYATWCSRWEKFLREFTLHEGHKQYTHERLRSARHTLNNLVKETTMFTFVELREERGGIWDSTNNIIEGAVNSQIRLMLLYHRGLSSLRRVKAVFWWCYLHSDFKTTEAEILKHMPTDKDVEGLFALASSKATYGNPAPKEFGTGVPEWSELKMSGSKETGWF